ncbi:DUF6000 family protein [Nonomuraea rhodomycinica]|uniref:Uncharacterized protein n=1 Tax=Nonomuraea rhodomycinica TaxID=1712872 RepID=A0A7Y6IS19_9ACTN|nr:DUF6000 family protein [Nonomuraea rhodomycinica]NUW42818.1 hypothetical protein [Nonomuraea rhodomycinica]
MPLPTPSDLRLTRAVRRYVTPGSGEVRRYLQLMGGFMMLPDRELIRFGRSLARDARRITDKDLQRLLAFEWRSRMTAGWLIGLDRRTRFREQLGSMLLESPLGYASDGYCFALARFGEERDAELLTACLDRRPPRVDDRHQWGDAIGALGHLDELRGAAHAARFVVQGGAVDETDLAYLSAYMTEKCAFGESCMAGTIEEWLPRRQLFFERWP